ncbi:MAG TPA: hypothetical protein VFE31_15750 [Opitutaceae bacterium]|jgi:hypothetical protein|nr:hypothetical protein [Opitutaceae bacterium]
MSELDPPVIAPAYQDRRIGLVVGGVIIAIVGFFFVLAALLAPIGQIAAGDGSGQPVAWNVVGSGVCTNLLIAIPAIWVGVGSLLHRRWVRPIVLTVSVLLAASGLFECALLPRVVARTLQRTAAANPLPPAAIAAAQWISLVVMLVLLVVIPALYFWYYGKRDVKLTLEARDPVSRWTDGKPVPLIGACVCLAWGAVYLLGFSLLLRTAFPLFGTVAPPAVSRLLWLAFALFSLYAARGFYRRDRAVWTAYFVVFLAMGASGLFTLHHLGLRELYARSGIPAGQADQILGVLSGLDHAVVAATAALVAGWLGFLLYLRRYFPPAAAEAGSGSAKAI